MYRPVGVTVVVELVVRSVTETLRISLVASSKGVASLHP
jgi:hypothetical protein